MTTYVLTSVKAFVMSTRSSLSAFSILRLVCSMTAFADTGGAVLLFALEKAVGLVLTTREPAPTLGYDAMVKKSRCYEGDVVGNVDGFMRGMWGEKLCRRRLGRRTYLYPFGHLPIWDRMRKDCSVEDTSFDRRGTDDLDSKPCLDLSQSSVCKPRNKALRPPRTPKCYCASV